VKRYRDSKTSEKRLWIEPDEIEAKAEAALIDAKMMPTVDAPVVDIERFVETYLKTQFDAYADLPADVLGQTDFRVGAKPHVMINKDLTRSALDDDDSPLGLKGRWRATVAHEGSHVIYHKGLFNLDPGQGSLFTDDPVSDEPKTMQRCLKRDVVHGRHGSDWREVQANMGMAALLMPRPVFVAIFQASLAKLGCNGAKEDSTEANLLAGTLAKTFEVSRQAAAIRMKTLSLLEVPGQKMLV
jgi:hypothetical protein